jgi:hypothetical protein
MSSRNFLRSLGASTASDAEAKTQHIGDGVLLHHGRRRGQPDGHRLGLQEHGLPLRHCRDRKGPALCLRLGSDGFVAELGYARCVLQSDGEPSLVAYRDAAREKYLKDVAAGAVELSTCRASRVGSHESNGGAERAVQTLRGLARVYPGSTQSKTGCASRGISPWCSWALRRAALLSGPTCGVMRDARLHAKLRWRIQQQPLVEFGELV